MRVRRAKLSALILFYGLSISSAALLAEDTTVASVESFRETHNPEVSVSGHVIVGVMAITAVQGIKKGDLSVGAASLSKGDAICLKASSRDGAYVLDGVYRLQEEPATSVGLPYHTERPDLVEGFSAETLTLTASVGACGEYIERYLLPQSGVSELDIVRVSVNSFNATDVFYQVTSDDGTAHEGECEYITEGRHTAYDFDCVFKLPEGEAPFALSIFRELYGRELETVELELLR